MLVPSFVVIVLMVWNLLSKETRVDAQMRWWQSIQTLFHLAHHEQFVSAARGIFTATSVEGYAQDRVTETFCLGKYKRELRSTPSSRPGKSGTSHSARV